VEYFGKLILLAFSTSTTTTVMELPHPPCAASGLAPSNLLLPHPSCGDPVEASLSLCRGQRRREVVGGVRWPTVVQGHRQDMITRVRTALGHKGVGRWRSGDGAPTSGGGGLGMGHRLRWALCGNRKTRSEVDTVGEGGTTRSIGLSPVTSVDWEWAHRRYFNFCRYSLRPMKVTISSVGPSKPTEVTYLPRTAFWPCRQKLLKQTKSSRFPIV
jgi:hypothetical protein